MCSRFYLISLLLLGQVFLQVLEADLSFLLSRHMLQDLVRPKPDLSILHTLLWMKHLTTSW